VTAAVKKLLSPDAKLAAEKHLGFVWANKKTGDQTSSRPRRPTSVFFSGHHYLKKKHHFLKVYDT
jgi:hypothetical protein